MKRKQKTSNLPLMIISINTGETIMDNICPKCKGKRFVMKMISKGTLKKIPCPECNKDDKGKEEK